MNVKQLLGRNVLVAYVVLAVLVLPALMVYRAYTKITEFTPGEYVGTIWSTQNMKVVGSADEVHKSFSGAPGAARNFEQFLQLADTNTVRAVLVENMVIYAAEALDKETPKKYGIDAPYFYAYRAYPDLMLEAVLKDIQYHGDGKVTAKTAWSSNGKLAICLSSFAYLLVFEVVLAIFFLFFAPR